MTIEERNNLIDDAIVKYKVCHDKYFPVGRSLTDKEWEDYIQDMDGIAGEFKNSKIADLSGELCMCFLNDIERIHKAWKAKGK